MQGRIRTLVNPPTTWLAEQAKLGPDSALGFPAEVAQDTPLTPAERIAEHTGNTDYLADPEVLTLHEDGNIATHGTLDVEVSAVGANGVRDIQLYARDSGSSVILRFTPARANELVVALLRKIVQATS